MRQTRLIFFSDLLALYRQIKRPLWIAGMACFLASCLLLLFLKVPRYYAHATFQQAAERCEEVTSLQSVLRSMRISGEDSSAISILQSKRLIGRVCQKLGLQIKPVMRFERLKKMQQNVLIGMGLKCESQSDIAFGDVSYTGEMPEYFYLRPLSEHQFELLDSHQEILVAGELGVPIATPEYKLTVLSMPKSETHFLIQPLWDCVQEHRHRLKIKGSRLDSKLLEISFSHSNRKEAIDFVDGLMQSMQEELANQHALLAEKQLAFLQQRKEELQQAYNCALKEHAAYLSETLGSEGLVGLTEEVEHITPPKEEYTMRLNALDLDLRRWQEINRSRQLLVHAIQENENPFVVPCEENLDLTAPLDPQFVGIDLPTAQKFYAEYSCQKDTLIADLKELSYVRKQLMQPSFEITALTKVMQDPVSQDMVQQAARVALQLCDEGNLSQKEQERLKDSLATQKRFILSHLNRIAELSKMKLGLVDRKMAGLQRTAIDLIRSERGILQEKLQELQDKMRSLPERWRLENQLKLKREMTLLIMEGMAQLTESKLVDHHLFSVGSRPLDHAYAPAIPSSARIPLFSSMGGLLGMVGYFLIQLLRKSPYGIPFTAPSLQALGAKVLCTDDLEQHLLYEMPQVTVSFAPLQKLSQHLAQCGYLVKTVSSADFPLDHKETTTQIASWRKEYDFILIEASFTEIVSSCKLADRVIAPIAGPEKLRPLLEMALNKTIFVT